MKPISVAAVNLVVKIEQRLLFQIPSFTISSGDAIYLSGHNGIGKTTLLKIIAGLQQPTSGHINLPRPTLLQKLAGFSGQSGIIYLHQNPYLFDGTVQENIAYGLKRKPFCQRTRQQLTIQALQKIGLENLLNQHISTLSGGERQKVAMARAWVLNPALLLMDESCANLDSDAIHTQQAMVKNLLDNGSSVVITSHHQNAITQYCNRQWRIENQQLIINTTNKDMHAFAS